MCELSARQVQVLDRLLRSPEGLTLGTIAAEIGVSLRTLQREFPVITQWLEAGGVQLVVRTGVGLRIEAPAERVQQALSRLAALNPEPELKVEARQNRLLHELLRSRSAKLAYFAKLLGVTETTISNDLDRLEPWLKERGLTLVRRPGMGVDLIGSELNVRRAMTALLRRHLTDEELYDQVRRIGQNQDLRHYLMQFLDPDIIQRVEITLKEMPLEGQLADSALAGLVVHLALTVQRTRQKEAVHLPGETIRKLQQTREWLWARQLIDRICQTFSLPMSEAEVGYITMHLRGARMRISAGRWAMPEPDDQVAMAAAREMVSLAAEATKMPIDEVPGLIHGLAMHLVPAINRIRLGLEIRNPLLAQIRSEYPEVFDISRKVCRVLAKHVGAPIPDEEVGFVAMHLGAAMERLRSNVQVSHRTVLVCPTGVGSSQLLAGRLSYAIPELEIIHVLSVAELPDFLRSLAVPPDLVLSTVPLDPVGIPVAVVGPLMRSPDVAAVRRRIKELPVPAADRSPRRPAVRLRGGGTTVHDDHHSDPEQMAQRAAVVGTLLVELFRSFRLRPLEGRHPIEAACDLLDTAGVPNDPALIQRDLHRREALGTTMVNDQLQLLHVRTQGVRAPFIGLLRAEDRSVVVMLAPESCSPETLEVLGAVSIAMVEQPDFEEILSTGSEEAVKKALGRILQPLMFNVK